MGWLKMYDKNPTLNADELRLQAEMAFLKKMAHSPENLDALSANDINQMFHELRVHQIELEMQNEELRRIQLELDTSRARYFDLYDLAPVGYCGVNEAGHILESNLSLCTMLKLERSSVIATSFDRFIHKDDHDIYYLLIKRILRTGDSESCELRLQCGDGAPLWVDLVASKVTDDMDLTTLRVAITNITERKQAEEQKNKLNVQLMQSQKMETVGQLAGGIAHDFNNILGIVMGNLQLLEGMVSSDENALNRVSQALKGVNRGAAIVKKLLGFSTVHSYETSLTSVNMLIENMGDLFIKSLTVAINIDTHLSSDLWRVNVDADGLDDAILNLGLNARDAMPDGGNLVIETANKVIDADFVRGNPRAKIGEYVMLSIKDSGIGMSPEVCERVLEPFFTTKKEGMGSGLGLSMVYGFVKRSDGFILIASALGKGTSIQIFLPRGQEIQSTKPVIMVEDELPRGCELVLVVDDEKDLVEIATSYLEIHGYRTLTAFDGNSALNILKDNPGIDLLFSDVIMPGDLDGYQLAIAARKARPSLKILLTSGFTKAKEDYSSPEGSLFVELASTLLTKPYNRTELTNAIRNALDDEC